MSQSASSPLPGLPSTPTEANQDERARRTRRPAWARVGARVAYLVLTGPAVVLFVLSLPTYYSQLQLVCPGLPSCSFEGQLSRGTLPWLQQAHLSVSAYAAALLALASLDGLLSLLVGIVIVWRLWGKENERLGLLTSFVLIVGGTLAGGSGSFTSFSPALPFFLDVVGLLSFLLYYPAVGMVLVTFPTGRFAPRWTGLVILLFIIQIFLYGPTYQAGPLLFAAERLLVWGSAFAVLAWRYRHLFTFAQRQQIKWLLYGFVPVYLVYLLYGALQSLPGLHTPDSLYLVVGPVFNQLFSLIPPLAIGIALLRYQLWDIDVIIRRTLVYTTLTTLLILLYGGLVLAFGSLLRGFLGQQQNPLVLVASTLLIATLFQPLRHGVQRVIDRRFYRRKYDAAKTLTAFSATLRSEVDLDQVREQLVTVVQETMQPAHISLWLRPTTKLTMEETSRPGHLR